MEIKEKLIKTLKEYKRLPISRLAAISGTNYNYAIRYLNELLKENKVKKEEETNSIFWSLK